MITIAINPAVFYVLIVMWLISTVLGLLRLREQRRIDGAPDEAKRRIAELLGTINREVEHRRGVETELRRMRAQTKPAESPPF